MFNYVLPGSTWVTFQRCKISQTVFSCCDMDAEDLAKAALKAIDDWLDEEIIGFEPEVFEPEVFEPEGRIESVCRRANWAIEEQPVVSGA